MTLNLSSKMKETVQWLRAQGVEAPQIGLILGSGLGVLADALEEPLVLAYADIPHFPVSTVAGHAGELLYGVLEGVPVLMMKGRFHLYEGYEAQRVAYPVQVMAALGVQSLIVTNAAGGINTSFAVGDLMLISDHINFMSRHPLIGPNDESIGPRFPDMSEPYSRDWRQRAQQSAAELGITLQEGTYVAVSGPSYETPAEIRMFRILGADAVGMSTVPEVIVARHAGLQVLGISCISNMASGVLDQPLSHEEVMETTEQVKPKFLQLIKSIIRNEATTQPVEGES